jgi:hypothetical protein
VGHVDHYVRCPDVGAAIHEQQQKQEEVEMKKVKK